MCAVTLALVTMVTVLNIPCVCSYFSACYHGNCSKSNVCAVTLALVTMVTVVNLTCVQLL